MELINEDKLQTSLLAQPETLGLEKSDLRTEEWGQVMQDKGINNQ